MASVTLWDSDAPNQCGSTSTLGQGMQAHCKINLQHCQWMEEKLIFHVDMYSSFGAGYIIKIVDSLRVVVEMLFKTGSLARGLVAPTWSPSFTIMSNV